MSPTASERVANRPLSGEEVKRLILADFSALLEADGMLQPHLAYGRVSWQIRLALHTGNPLTPESITSTASRQPSTQAIRAQPELSAVLPWMQAQPDTTATASTLSRDVASPNAERVRAGFPIPVDVKQTDGTTLTQSIQYPADPSQGSRPVIADASPDPRPAWGGMLDEIQDVTIPEIGMQDTTPAAPPVLLPLTPEQIAAQSARINAIAEEKISSMTPEEEATINKAFGA